MIKLAETISKDSLDAQIAIVISNRHCVGITRAANLDIPTTVIERQTFTTRREHDAAIRDAIIDSAADYVFLAGYMAILGVEFTNAFAGKLINIHPSLLPNFKGLGTHQSAIDKKVARHGATVHLVTAELDGGPVLLQAELSVLADDDANSLASRVLLLEHQLYPFVLRCLSQGQLILGANNFTWLQPELVLQMASASCGQNFAEAIRWPHSIQTQKIKKK